MRTGNGKSRAVVLYASVIETLEHRRLLAATPSLTKVGSGLLQLMMVGGASVTDNGICAITGADSADTISIYTAPDDSTAGEHLVVSVGTVVTDLAGKDIRGFRISGLGGDDVIQFKLPNKGRYAALRNTIDGGSGNDKITGSGGLDRIYCGDGNDTVSGLGGRDKIYAGAGDDVVTGGAGGDHVWGGDGNDDIAGQNGRDRIYGEAGLDSISGGAHNDSIGGGTDIDVLVGGRGDDAISGEAGDDTLSGNDGNDSLKSNGGNDHLFGGKGQDSLYGDGGDNLLAGGDGNDLFWAGGGDDTLMGGAGDDDLNGEEGEDELFGGAGNDDFYPVQGPNGESDEDDENKDLADADVGHNSFPTPPNRNGSWGAGSEPFPAIITGGSQDAIVNVGGSGNLVIGDAGAFTPGTIVTGNTGGTLVGGTNVNAGSITIVESVNPNPTITPIATVTPILVNINPPVIPETGGQLIVSDNNNTGAGGTLTLIDGQIGGSTLITPVGPVLGGSVIHFHGGWNTGGGSGGGVLVINDPTFNPDHILTGGTPVTDPSPPAPPEIEVVADPDRTGPSAAEFAPPPPEEGSEDVTDGGDSAPPQEILPVEMPT